MSIHLYSLLTEGISRWVSVPSLEHFSCLFVRRSVSFSKLRKSDPLITAPLCKEKLNFLSCNLRNVQSNQFSVHSVFCTSLKCFYHIISCNLSEASDVNEAECIKEIVVQTAQYYVSLGPVQLFLHQMMEIACLLE